MIDYNKFDSDDCYNLIFLFIQCATLHCVVILLADLCVYMYTVIVFILLCEGTS